MRSPPPWKDRRFAMDVDPSLAPILLERLRGAPWRAQGMLLGASAEALCWRPERGWSVLDHLGHLADLDRSLFLQRLRAIREGEPRLAPADLDNPDTWGAGHDLRDVEDVLGRFRQTRRTVAAWIDKLDPEELELGAEHPRLGSRMRVIDMMLFHAEHDDHHFAWMRHLMLGAIR